MTARLRNARLTLRYEDDLRLFRSHTSRAAMAGFVVLAAVLPFLASGFWVSVLNYAGIAAIGAIGLNLLTGYAGQVSLGHAFFLGAGAYAAAFVGDALGLPILLWLPAAALVGGLIGGLIGPFALRLRGNYLVIITLGLLFIGQHVFENWVSLTGGLTGRPVRAAAAVGPLDFADPAALGVPLARDQGYYYLIWLLVALLALAAKNIVRGRPGRALQAVRDRDIAAEVIGVSLVRYKVGAFVISSAYAAMAGALYAAYTRYVSPLDWSLLLSIQYIAMIIVGGIGTIFGSILGALFLIAMPPLVVTLSDALPFVAQGSGGDGMITVHTLNQALFGLLIVVFLVLEPRGLAHVWFRVKAYFKAWPFSY